MRNRIMSLALSLCILATMLVPVSAAEITQISGSVINGDYVLVVNQSITQTENTGVLNFDSENIFTTTDATADLPAVSQQTGVSGQEKAGVERTAIITKTYTEGETKIISGKTFEVIGTSNKAVIWMETSLKSQYQAQNLTAALTSIKNIYDNYSYAVLKKLGADAFMNYADGSGKLSILLEVEAGGAAGYFSSSDITQNGLTAIHIPISSTTTMFAGYGPLLAHEGQHALNYYTQEFTTWLNEGLSIAAMDMYYKGTDGLNWLNNCVQNYNYKSGVSMITDKYTGNNALDYSIPFLFLRYLNAQANKGFDYNSDFYGKLYKVQKNTTSGIANDAAIIEQVLKQYDSFKNQDGSYWTFEQAFTNFRIAAFKQADTGIYGFYGDSVVKSKIGAPPIYFGESGKDISLAPTGAIIIKTVDGKFTIPEKAGADIKFIPFSYDKPLNTDKTNRIVVGSKLDATIYKDSPITFDELRVVIVENGSYSKVYKGLAEIYSQGYTLVAFRGFGSSKQYTYELGKLAGENIKKGDYLILRKGSGVVNSVADWGISILLTSSAVVKETKAIVVTPVPTLVPTPKPIVTPSPTLTPDPTVIPTVAPDSNSSKLRIEAEDAQIVGSTRIEKMAAASNGKLVSYLDRVGNSVTFKNVIKANGLTIGYTKGLLGLGKLSLYINNVHTQDITFQNTSGWGTKSKEYKEYNLSLDIPMDADIKFQFDSGDTAVNIDYIEIDKNGAVEVPTVVPTIIPTVVPTVTPTIKPTAEPTVLPTTEPTVAPTHKPAPVKTPTPSLKTLLAPQGVKLTKVGAIVQATWNANKQNNGYVLKIYKNLTFYKQLNIKANVTKVNLTNYIKSLGIYYVSVCVNGKTGKYISSKYSNSNVITIIK